MHLIPRIRRRVLTIISHPRSEEIGPERTAHLRDRARAEAESTQGLATREQAKVLILHDREQAISRDNTARSIPPTTTAGCPATATTSGAGPTARSTRAAAATARSTRAAAATTRGTRATAAATATTRGTRTARTAARSATRGAWASAVRVRIVPTGGGLRPCISPAAVTAPSVGRRSRRVVDATIRHEVNREEHTPPMHHSATWATTGDTAGTRADFVHADGARRSTLSRSTSEASRQFTGCPTLQGDDARVNAAVGKTEEVALFLIADGSLRDILRSHEKSIRKSVDESRPCGETPSGSSAEGRVGGRCLAETPCPVTNGPSCGVPLLHGRM